MCVKWFSKAKGNKCFLQKRAARASHQKRCNAICVGGRPWNEASFVCVRVCVQGIPAHSYLLDARHLFHGVSILSYNIDVHQLFVHRRFLVCHRARAFVCAHVCCAGDEACTCVLFFLSVDVSVPVCLSV